MRMSPPSYFTPRGFYVGPRNNPLKMIRKAIQNNPFSMSGKKSNLAFAGIGTKKGAGLVNLKMMGDIDLNNMSIAFRDFSNEISAQMAKTLSVIGADLLAQAQPRVPYDTGELRESGRAWILFHRGKGGSKKEPSGSSYFKDVAKGLADGYVIRITPSIGEMRGRVRGMSGITLNVGYSRVDHEETGFKNVAIIVHEDIYPFGSGKHPAARKEGTGPYYLSTPWVENKAEYINLIHRSFSQPELNKIVRRVARVGKHGKSMYRPN